MEISTSASPPSCSSSSSRKIRELCISAVSAVICNLVYAVLAFLFAEVGATLGAAIGALSAYKQNTTEGCLHGAVIGAINGVILSKEFLRMTIDIWNSDDASLDCFLSLFDLIGNLMRRSHYQEEFNVTTKSC